MQNNKYQPNTLYHTDNYAIFNAHAYNRPLRENPQLLESMRRHGFLAASPLHCEYGNDSGSLSVIRGHHRLQYAQRLGLPVWFVVSKTRVDIYDLEGSSAAVWSAGDFVASRASAGEATYKALQAFAKENSLPIGVAACLYMGESAGSGNARRLVKTGDIQKGDQGHTVAVLRVLAACDVARVPFARSSAFVAAVSSVLRIPELSQPHLAKKLREQGAKMRRVGTRDAYIREIEAAYNHGLRDRLPVAIRAREVGRHRKAAFGRDDG